MIWSHDRIIANFFQIRDRCNVDGKRKRRGFGASFIYSTDIRMSLKAIETSAATNCVDVAFIYLRVLLIVLFAQRQSLKGAACLCGGP